MRYIGFAIIIILILLGISFAVLNSDTVTIHYYAGKRDFPLSLLMAISFAIGALLGILAMIPQAFKLRWRNRRLKRKLRGYEQEVTNLRKLPVQDDHL